MKRGYVIVMTLAVLLSAGAAGGLASRWFGGGGAGEVAAQGQRPPHRPNAAVETELADEGAVVGCPRTAIQARLLR